MKRVMLRERGGEWCALEVELRDSDQGPVLSICGSAGTVMTRAAACKEALAYWESFFEESPDELRAMGDRFNRVLRTPEAGARFVVATDGEFHGLDVYRQDGDRVYLMASGGQIREELTHWFPEAVPFFRWHMNDMRVSPARTETVTDAWGATRTRRIPEGAAWDYEPLPPEVIAWANSLPEAP